RGLGGSAVTGLLGQAGQAIAPAVGDGIVAATAGNPLALLEVPSLLSPEQLAGEEPLPGPIPTSETLERAFLAQVEQLPEMTQRALLIAAASPSNDFEEILAAVERADLASDALDPAEQADLTMVDGTRFESGHPLVRSAIYHGAPAVQRRAAHHALAGAGGERRPWHLAAASESPDPAIAAELQQTASSSSGRGGHAEAASAFEAAARLA